MKDKDLLVEDLGKLKVSDFLDSCGEEPSTIGWGESIQKMVEALFEHRTSRAVYVLDEDKKLLGMVLFRDIIRVMNARLGIRGRGVSGSFQYLRDAQKDKAHDLMRPPVKTKLSTPLCEALEKMEDSKINDLPVVDDKNRLVGELSGLKVLHLVYCGA
jgi:CBS domain-containing protein